MTKQWQQYLDEHQDQFVAHMCDLLRIPSISTDAAYQGEVRRAADWVADRLTQAGIEGVAVLETGGHPVVYGEWLHAPGKPTLLVYGHFDVQPADPLAKWTTPPFEPTIREGLIFARGASDMKGNLILPIIACEALLRTEGSLPVNIKFLYEGEEEIGSPSLEPFIQANQERLACDWVVSCDGGNGNLDRPTVGVSLRGLAKLQVNLRTAATDLHSGQGGMYPNAIHALVRLLDSMRDDEGRILVEGFYDAVRPLTDGVRAEIAALPFNPEQAKQAAGVQDFFGEPEFTPQERVMVRPTLEINGIWGGYQGEGSKTVIPMEAAAKITCRLVPDQDPETIRAQVLAHIQRHAPAYAEVTVEATGGGADAYAVPTDHPSFVLLERVVQETTGLAPVRMRGGGTVPIMGMLKQILGVETITLGGSGPGERLHAPNEFYRLANFERAQRAYCLYLQAAGAPG